MPEAAAAAFGGESRDPEAVRDRLIAAVRAYAASGVPEELFSRMKKACYGLNVRALDQLDELCRMQAELGFTDECCLDFADVYDTITAEDVREMFARWAQPDRTSLSVIRPIQTEETV